MSLKAWMARPISSSRPGLDAGAQIAGRQLRQSGGQLLDGPADAVRQVNQQGQRNQPERRRQQQVNAV